MEEEENLNELGKLRRKYEVHVIDVAKVVGCSPSLLMKYEIGLEIKNKKYLEKIDEILKKPKDMYYLSSEYKFYQNISDYDKIRIKQMILLLINEKEYTLKLYRKLVIADKIANYYTGKTLTGVIDFEKKLDEIVNDLCNGDILNRVITYNEDNSVTDIVYKVKDVDYDCLDEKQLYVIGKVNDYFKEYSLKDIMNYEISDYKVILS